MIINLITGLFFFSQLTFGGINTQIKSEAKQEEAPQADAAIVFIDGQASCLTFSESASADWQDTVQDESGLELCSQQQNSQEVQGFVQSFQSDTIAEDSQYAFWPYVIAGVGGVGGCMVGGILSAYDKASSASPDVNPALVAATVAVTLTVTVTFTFIAITTASNAQMLLYSAAFVAGSILCNKGLSAVFIEEEESHQD